MFSQCRCPDTLQTKPSHMFLKVLLLIIALCIYSVWLWSIRSYICKWISHEFSKLIQKHEAGKSSPCCWHPSVDINTKKDYMCTWISNETKITYRRQVEIIHDALDLNDVRMAHICQCWSAKATYLKEVYTNSHLNTKSTVKMDILTMLLNCICWHIFENWLHT